MMPSQRHVLRFLILFVLLTGIQVYKKTAELVHNNVSTFKHTHVKHTAPLELPQESQESKMYPDLHNCSTKPLQAFIQKQGMYWILENYITASLRFRCNESITLSTHADHTYLDNLVALTSRWQIPTTEELLSWNTTCGANPPKWSNVATYRNTNNLLYPVNVARNTARLTAQTYFVFPSDVELYPSDNFITDFLQMLKQTDYSNTTQPRVFVFSIFEIKINIIPPRTKYQLQKLLIEGDAVPFHKGICAACHNIPKSKEWQMLPYTPGLKVFHIGKRMKPFHAWEPIYVGTNKEPLYEERLSWEGKNDKMTQMYILCVLGYEFHILDNAFLVHRPGIKKYRINRKRNVVVAKQSSLIRRYIMPEYKTIFGHHYNCIA